MKSLYSNKRLTFSSPFVLGNDNAALRTSEEPLFYRDNCDVSSPTARFAYHYHLIWPLFTHCSQVRTQTLITMVREIEEVYNTQINLN